MAFLKPDQADDLERDTDLVIATCRGNARDAVRTLLILNGYLETELARVKATASAGYERRRRVKRE